MRYVLTVLALLAMASPLAAAPLTIMVEDASEPFSRRDGSGYANDIVRAAFKASGIDVTFDVVPYARCKKSVQDGVTPACFAMSWSPGMAGKVVFSDKPIFAVHADVFRNARTGRSILAATDFRKGDVLGLINAYEYSEAINSVLRRGVVAERGSNDNAILSMLARGRIDAAVIMTSDFVDSEQLIAGAEMKGVVRFAYRAGTLQSFVGFSQKHPEGNKARIAFNGGYAVISRDGTGDRIRADWIRRVRR